LDARVTVVRPAVVVLAALLAAGCYEDLFAPEWESTPAVDENDFAAVDDDDAIDDDDVGPPPSTTLISIDDSTNQLLLVDETTGAGTPVVTLDPARGMCSSVFTRRGTLFTSGGGRLWRLDPCTGDVVEVGAYSDDARICGLATNDLRSLYGLNRATGDLVSIDADTAAITVIGPTGVEWGTHGLTWDDDEGRFLAVNGADDRLYSIDPGTGAATLLTDIDLDFATVGVEMDPVSGAFFACTRQNLHTIDVQTGAVTVVGPIGPDPSCDDLGATWIDVDCL